MRVLAYPLRRWLDARRFAVRTSMSRSYERCRTSLDSAVCLVTAVGSGISRATALAMA